MKHTSIHSFIVIIFSIFIASACKSGKENEPKDTNAELDSFYTQFNEKVFQDPAKTKDEIKTLKNKTIDSIDYFNLSVYYSKALFYDNKIDSAIHSNRQVIAFLNRNADTSQRTYSLATGAYNDIAVFFQTIGIRDSAIFYLNKAIASSTLSNEKEKRINIYINLADNLAQNSDFTNATATYRKALLLSDSLKLQKKYNAPIYLGLSKIYIDLNNFDQADTYLTLIENQQDSLELYEQFYYLTTRGNYYFNKDEHEKSIPVYHKLLELTKKYNQIDNRMIAEINLGESHLRLHHLDSAQYYLNNVSDYYFNQIKNPATSFYLRGLFAYLYLLKNDTKKAEQLLNTPFDSTAVNAAYINIQNKRMEELYRQKADFKKALSYSRKVQEYENDKRDFDVKKNIEEINLRYQQDTTLLNKDIVIHEQEEHARKLNQNLFLSIASFFILALIASIVYILKRKKAETILADQKAAITKLRMENIQNRVTPHFIFNALNALMPSLRKHEELKIPIEKLIESIRHSLNYSDKMSISLKDEMKHVKTYINLLESLNYELPEIKWEVDYNIHTSTRIPAMCIQIPVENALKYAFDEHKAGDSVTIRIENQLDSMRIAISDNGKGLQSGMEQNKKRGTGSGLKIIMKTIEILNAKNSNKIEFNLTDKLEQSGTSATISIPYNYKFES